MGLFNVWGKPAYERQQFLSAVANFGGASFSDSNQLMISLPGRRITDAALAQLAAMPGAGEVTQLVVCRSAAGHSCLTDAGMEHLAKFPKMTVVAITDCPNITDSGMQKLKAVSLLKAVYLFGCPGVTDDGVAWLAHRPGLEVLDVAGTQVTHARAIELAGALPNCQIAHAIH
jgi:hypothetical protein